MHAAALPQGLPISSSPTECREGPDVFMNSGCCCKEVPRLACPDEESEKSKLTKFNHSGKTKIGGVNKHAGMRCANKIRGIP